MKIQNIIVLGLAVLLGAAWFVLALMGKTAVEPLVAFIQSSLVSIGAYVLTMARGPAPDQAATALASAAAPAAPPPSGQAGRVRLELLVAGACIAIVMVLAAGCTTTTASVYSGLYTQAKAGVTVFDDNTLTTMRDLLCAQPYSAVQRHPEMQSAIQQLCGPLANATSLDAGQLQLLMSMVGKAQAAGLLAVPAAAASAPSGPKP